VSINSVAEVTSRSLGAKELAVRNHAWIIEKPSRGRYTPDCLRWEERDVPSLADGEVLVRTELISIDPTTRNWLLLEPEKMMIPLQVGDVMIGVAVGHVVESRADGFETGDLVSGIWGWEEYSVASPMLIEKHVDGDAPLEAYLSVFSHVGRAAIMGLSAVGDLRPSDTVVVSGAAGATGSLAVQIAKAAGCRVVGIAGGAEKCAYVAAIGADATIDYKSEDVLAALRAQCPTGVDLFFDNVGGAILDAVLVSMAVGCRIVVCGAMSQYDLERPEDQYGVKNLQMLLFRSARMEGFVVPQFAARQAEFDARLHELWNEGAITQRSHVIDGLEHAPETVNLNLQGRNEGKLMVRVAGAAA
jgi:NADPH-dependent curcumin reductase CurA